jgi:hypothetical protein
MSAIGHLAMMRSGLPSVVLTDPRTICVRPDRAPQATIYGKTLTLDLTPAHKFTRVH